MRLTTRWVDIYALVVLALIALSGFFLEATKIVSHERYEEMVAGFSSVSDEQEAEALRAYWAKEYAVVFPKTPMLGRRFLSQRARGSCQQLRLLSLQTTAAFVSYGLAKAITPAAFTLSQKGIQGVPSLFSFLGLFSRPGFIAFHQIFSYPGQPSVASDQRGDGSDQGLSRQYRHHSGHRTGCLYALRHLQHPLFRGTYLPGNPQYQYFAFGKVERL